MSITIDGDLGISGVDGTAASPAIRGNDSNTGISYGTDIVTINTGGVARVTTNASGNVGIGTASPNEKLTLVNASGNTKVRTDSGSNQIYMGWDGADAIAEVATNGAWRVRTGGSFNERLRLDTSGNVGIGTSSPASKLHISAGSSSTIQLGDTSTTGYFGQINNTANNLNIIANGDQAFRVSVGTNNGSGNIVFFTANGTTGNTERARIDASGNLLVGKTSSDLSIAGFEILTGTGPNRATKSGNAAFEINRLTSTGELVRLYYNTANVGSISTNGTSTAYNTTSDYRLKENVAPMTGALATVAALKPCTYTWKADGSAGQGFIAHELQAVVPDCVTGNKDAVDADGNPQYQGVDTSFLVATLVAAIQEQQATIAAMETRLAALEA